MDAARAYRIVRTALKQGNLKRASFCARCGKPDVPASDGRSTIHAHHFNGYDNPLSVEWLCAKCHRDETPLPETMGAPNFGEKNGSSKLTAEQVEIIRKSPDGCRKLGRRFGINKMQIQRIRNGTAWIAAAPASTSGEVGK